MRCNFFWFRKNSDFNDFSSKISLSSYGIISAIHDYDLNKCDIDHVKLKMHFYLDEVGSVLDRIMSENSFLKKEQVLREISKVQKKVLPELPGEVKGEFDRKIEELKIKVTGEPHQSIRNDRFGDW